MTRLFEQGRAIPILLPNARRIIDAVAYLQAPDDIALERPMQQPGLDAVVRFSNAFRLLCTISRLAEGGPVRRGQIYLSARSHRPSLSHLLGLFVQCGFIDRSGEECTLNDLENPYLKWIELITLI